MARSYGALSVSIGAVESTGQTNLYNPVSFAAIEEGHNVGCQFVDGMLACFTGHS